MNLKYPEIPSDEFLQELVERAKNTDGMETTARS